MNAIDALRLADPARSDAAGALGPDDERVLQRILATPTTPTTPTSAERPPHRPDRRPVLVTVAVAAVVVALAVVVIRLGAQAPHVASTSEPTVPTVTTELRQALTRVFPEAFDGRPAQTWTDASPSPQGDGMLDLTGKHPAYAVACEGGGAVAVRITGQPDRILDCAHLSTLGPVGLGARPADTGVEFAVAAASGHPRYLLRLTALQDAPTAGTGTGDEGTTTRDWMVVTPTPSAP